MVRCRNRLAGSVIKLRTGEGNVELAFTDGVSTEVHAGRYLS
jgi:hypothetical protein